MLSDEEKAVLKTAKENYGLTSAEQKILVNLIEKQQKEIEELKETLKCTQNSWYEDTKIIEELKKEYERVREGRNWLSEHISAQIATPELFDRIVEENYISNDKIKAKIEELIKEGNYRTADNPKGRVHFQKEITDYQIEVLQSLLEKE